jgi:hypothetical protein
VAERIKKLRKAGKIRYTEEIFRGQKQGNEIL